MLGKNNKCNRNISYGDGGYILSGYLRASINVKAGTAKSFIFENTLKSII